MEENMKLEEKNIYKRRKAIGNSENKICIF